MDLPTPLAAFAYFQRIVASQKNGRPAGVTCVCSAHPVVIEAAMRFARREGCLLCIESTAEQVNQFGGYTGMRPIDFVASVTRIGRRTGFPLEWLVLGGDHLGPGPWRGESAVAAMKKAGDLVRDYRKAGFTKIHLDTGMPCIDDPLAVDGALSPLVAAGRSAELCGISEASGAEIGDRPVYVIGNEVPPPGGRDAAMGGLPVSAPADVERFLSMTRHQFERRRLIDAWQRTVAIVVNSGVEFGPDTVSAYERARTTPLVRFIRADSQLVYEAHSTDYQTESALSEMVEDQFAVLKVGPELTFTLREALFALSFIEEEWLSGRKGIVLSALRRVIDETMTKDPVHWLKYYGGDDRYRRYARSYGLSDRIRYYWSYAPITAAVDRLMHNLDSEKIPLALIRQYLPNQYDRVREGALSPTPLELVYHKIEGVLHRYFRACRAGKGALACPKG